jgi:Uma2 family endonuclease
MGLASRQLFGARKSNVPLLYPGDHLDQPEFLRRYEAYPDPQARFELIGGIVYMMSPAGFEHGSNEYRATGVLMWYEAHTLGVEGATSTTVILGPKSQPEPDALLMIRPEFGGQARVKRFKDKYYVAGAPELIWEVSHSSVAIDLNAKFADYAAAGVREYIVHCLEERELRWFDLAHEAEIEAGRDGVFKSRLFPGLWVDLPALLNRDTQRLATTLEKGLETPAHAEFVARLARQRRRNRKGGK